MYDGRTNLAQQVAAEVRKHFPGKVYKTVIPRTVRLAEAPSFGKPITTYDSGSYAAQCYRSLTDEMLAPPVDAPTVAPSTEMASEAESPSHLPTTT
jgi:cellulose biosynthesis protein BcsQ